MNSHDLLLVHIGTVIEEDSLTLGQLCRACDVHADWIISLVEEGIIEPQGEDIRLWRFQGQVWSVHVLPSEYSVIWELIWPVLLWYLI
jgi:hypothetical protein